MCVIAIFTLSALLSFGLFIFVGWVTFCFGWPCVLLLFAVCIFVGWLCVFLLVWLYFVVGFTCAHLSFGRVNFCWYSVR